MSLPIPVCAACGTAAFPPRVLCARCGGAEWIAEPVESGIVEAVTELDGTHIAAIRTPLGPVVIARLKTDAHPGDSLSLATTGLVPVAGN